MPTIIADGAGYVRQSKTDFSGTSAWFIGQPLVDASAGLAYNSQGRNAQSIYCTFAIVGSATVTDIRFPFMSFDVSGISSAPASATLKIWGYSNSTTGNPTGHSTDGIQGWAPDYGGQSMSSTTSVAITDWGLLAAGTSPYMPTQLTDNLTTWNTGTSTANTFTLTAAALSDIGSANNFQIAIGHKYWWDTAYSNPPFTAGNSPNSDSDFTAVAGMYFGFGDGTYAAYKPQLIIPDGPVEVISPTDIKINGGSVTLGGGSLKVDNT